MHARRDATPGLSLRDALGLFALYAVCHAGIFLLSSAYFWDDWVFRHASADSLLSTFSQLGSAFNISGHLHTVMSRLGPGSYALSTFVLFFASGLALERVLRRHPVLPKDGRLLVVLLFLLLPFNSSRIAHSVFQYTFSYALFFAAWALVDRHRVAAAALFFLSFNTNSLLVLYALPVADLLYRRGAFASARSLVRSAAQHADLIILPLVFFGLKSILFVPYGGYEGYNAITGLGKLPMAVARTGWNWLVSLASPVVLWTALLAVPVALMLRRLGPPAALPPGKVLLTVGAAAMALGAFPYLLLGLVPGFGVWDSRHQLLLPLGGALAVLGLLQLLLARAHNPRAFQAAALAMLLSWCGAYWLTFYAHAFADWQKQERLIAALAAHPELRSARLVVFDDKTEAESNLHGRYYRPYEWIGIMRAAFQDASRDRIGVGQGQYEAYKRGYLRHALGLYGIAEGAADPKVRPILVTITKEAPSCGVEAWCARFRVGVSLPQEEAPSQRL